MLWPAQRRQQTGNAGGSRGAVPLCRERERVRERGREHREKEIDRQTHRYTDREQNRDRRATKLT